MTHWCKQKNEETMKNNIGDFSTMLTQLNNFVLNVT